MRPFVPTSERLNKRVSEKGPTGKTLAILDVCDEHMVALSVLAGEPKMTERNLKARDGKTNLKDENGKNKTETIAVLDSEGQPIYEGSELSQTEEILYRVVSSLLQIIRADKTWAS